MEIDPNWKDWSKEMEEKKVQLEITSDPSDSREIILHIIKELRGKDNKPSSRAVALAITKLEEARFWLGESLYGEEAFQKKE